MRRARPGRGRGRAASRGAPPPALAAAALAACVGPLGRLAQAQECATVNVYDNTPDVSGSCAEFVAQEIVRENGEPFLCDPDFIAGGDHAG